MIAIRVLMDMADVIESDGESAITICDISVVLSECGRLSTSMITEGGKR